jgi:hypothetical protein
MLTTCFCESVFLLLLFLGKCSNDELNTQYNLSSDFSPVKGADREVLYTDEHESFFSCWLSELRARLHLNDWLLFSHEELSIHIIIYPSEPLL